MLKEIETHRDQIAALCRRYGARRLEIFGSAARGSDFEPGRNDVDFLIVILAPGFHARIWEGCDD